MKPSRQGTVLIVCVGLVALMLIMGSAFMVTVSNQRGAGQVEAYDRLARIAAESGLDHAVAALRQDFDDQTVTIESGRWRQDFLAIGTDGLPVNPWEMSGSMEAPRLPDPDPRVNVPHAMALTNVIRRFGSNGTDNVKDPIYYGGRLDETAGAPEEGSAYNITPQPTARWHAVDSFGADLLHDDSAAAQFELRYAVQVLDVDSHLRVNPDYPDAAGTAAALAAADHPVTFNAADPDNLGYLAHQAYLQRFARSLASMYGTREARHVNYNPYHFGYDPFDTERVDLAPDGHRNYGIKSDESLGQRTGQDGYRMTAAQLFRGERLTWNVLVGNIQLNRLSMLAHSGRVYSYGTVGLHTKHGNAPTPARSTWIETTVLSPFGHGLRDQDWHSDPSDRSNGLAADNPNVPWRVNLLTAPRRVRELILWGLASSLRWQERQDSGRGSPADLFGIDYPEAFPLGLDDGRDVRLVGGDLGNGNDQVDWGVPRGEWGDPGTLVADFGRNDYWWDAIAALAKVVDVSQLAWNRGWDPRDPAVAGGEIHDSASLLDISETDPDRILEQIEAEWLRVLGEDITAPGSGMLAGLGGDSWTPIGYGATIDSRLEPGANSRALEYLLNDLRMSLFGSAAENFNGDDANGDGVVDRDDAESTRAGWYHNGERTWSFWHAGVHAVTSPSLAYLEEPGWYRFWYGDSRSTPAVAGGICNRMARWDGEGWVETALSDPAAEPIFAVNRCFLNGSRQAWSASNPPIKPWSATGRFFVGPSRTWRILVKGQLYDLVNKTHVSEANIDAVWAIDPRATDTGTGSTRFLYRWQHMPMPLGQN